MTTDRSDQKNISAFPSFTFCRKLKQLEQETKVAKRDNEVSGENQDSLESVFSDIRIEKPLGKNKQKLKENVEAAKEKSDLSMEQAAFLQKRAKMRRAKEAEKLAGKFWEREEWLTVTTLGLNKVFRCNPNLEAKLC